MLLKHIINSGNVVDVERYRNKSLKKISEIQEDFIRLPDFFSTRIPYNNMYR